MSILINSIPPSFPSETLAEVKEKIIRLSVEHPAWGQVKISDNLRLEGIQVSPSTVRNIWLKEGLESKYRRISFMRLKSEASMPPCFDFQL